MNSELAELESATKIVYDRLDPTPQIRWPLLEARFGCPVWLKHENHLPTGAFKVRGGLVYFHHLLASGATPSVICATRGNHGQSVAFAARVAGVKALIVVPKGNNPDKNDAMKALGAELVIHGEDFIQSLNFAQDLAQSEGHHWVPSFHSHLVSGVGTYALELLRAAPDLQRLYVPIGLGSGACGVLKAKTALDNPVQVIGVVSSHAPTYLESMIAGHPVMTDHANTLADGLAVRQASAEALEPLRRGLSKVISVTDDEVLDAMAILLSDTHNLVEGAGAAPLAAALRDQDSISPGDHIALVISGGNVSADILQRVLGRSNRMG